MSQAMPEPGTPEPDTSPPEEEEGEKYDGGDIPPATESPEADGEE